MKKKKILVVEDERLVAEDIAECLEGAGYEVCGIASNGDDALELAGEHRPNLVLEDIVIRGDRDGIETAVEMRKRFDIPSIFLTAYSQNGILERAKEAAPLGFIIKPFDEEGLLSAVKLALHKAALDVQLRESADWFSTTLNSIGDGVIATDIDGRVRFMNRVAEQLTGWMLDEAEGCHITDIFCVEEEVSEQPVVNPALEAMKFNKVRTLAAGCILRSRTGRRIPIDDSGAPIHDGGDDLLGAVLIFRDVSEKRESEKKLQLYQEELKDTVDRRTRALQRRVDLERLNNNIASRLLVSDCDRFNRQLQDGLQQIVAFLGIRGVGIFRSEDDSKNCYLPVAVYSTDSERLKEALQRQPGAQSMPWFTSRLEEDGKVVINSLDEIPNEARTEREHLEIRGVGAAVMLPFGKDGDQIICFTSGEQRNWMEDEIVGLNSITTILENGMERQRFEVEKNLLREQLHQAQKLEAIGKLTGGIAHDFNNMLVPIIGYADSILNESEKLKWEEEIKEIRKAADSAASLTGQLLAFSRKQILHKRPLRVNREVAEMDKMIRRILGEDVDLILHTKARRDVVEADRGQLQQVLVNLCVNARDAMPEGGAIAITTNNPPDNEDQVVIEVRDTGCGMTEEVREKAFDPFFSTKGNDGTGLGLSVVMGIVQQHNGSMELSSEPGEGTVFTIRFPLSKESASPDKAPERTVPSEEEGRNGERILLVEDEPAVMTFVRTALSKWNYEVVEAKSRKEAVRIFDEEEGEFDLVFTDAKLPDGTGIEVLEHVFLKDSSMKALISSGYTDDRALVDQARRRGVRFLQKPYPLSELYDSVQLALTEKKENSEVVELPR